MNSVGIRNMSQASKVARNPRYNQKHSTTIPSIDNQLGNVAQNPNKREAVYGDPNWQNQAKPRAGSPVKAPQFQIEQIKKEIKERSKENEGLRDKIYASDVFNKKLTEGMREFRAKVGQCQADKVEIMRDLATYEVNYAQNTRNATGRVLRDRLSGLLDLVKGARTKCQQYIKFGEDGEAYFTESSYSLNTDGGAATTGRGAAPEQQHLGLPNQEKDGNKEAAGASQKEVDYILKQMLTLQKTKQNRYMAYQKFNDDLISKLSGMECSDQDSPLDQIRAMNRGTFGKQANDGSGPFAIGGAAPQQNEETALTIIDEYSPMQSKRADEDGQVRNKASGAGADKQNHRSPLNASSKLTSKAQAKTQMAKRN